MKSIDGEEYIPRRATTGSAGYDFFMPETVHIEPGEWTDVDSGISFDGSENVVFNTHDIDMDWFMLIVPRSGMGAKYGLRIRNTAGIIDRDYRGRIRFSLTADVPITIEQGARFAQGIFVPFGILTDEIPPKDERNGGHGSTGE